MKIISMYLPQFYRTPENDNWWGEGYTEWEAVKACRPLYEGHLQPHKPINEYNLLDRKAMEWQAELMHKYSVDGMCFYHYYFDNHHQMLEQPAQNLLKWKDINMPFCFSWANESWIKTWTNIRMNDREGLVWSANENFKKVLMEQKYGNKTDWADHFNYLLPFFKDERYIVFDDKPLFIIYMPHKIPHLRRMIDCWQLLAKENGLKGISFWGTNVNYSVLDMLDGVLLQEPQDTIRFYGDLLPDDKSYGINKTFDYDDVWKYLLTKEYSEDKVCFGGFPKYDDAPRHGKKGMQIVSSTPDRFKHYMSLILKKSYINNKPFLFINAWNEWGEGMYLEPDADFGSGYLEAIRDARQEVINESVDRSWYLDELNRIISDTEFKITNMRIRREKEKKDRYYNESRMLQNWMRVNNNNVSIAESIKADSLNRVAVYGEGSLGKLLIKDLLDNGVSISYVVDKGNPEHNYSMIPLYHPEDSLPYVDLMIVTVEHDYQSIETVLSEKNINRIMKLSDLISHSMPGEILYRKKIELVKTKLREIHDIGNKGIIFFFHDMELTGASVVLMDMISILYKRGFFISAIGYHSGSCQTELEKKSIPTIIMDRDVLDRSKKINELEWIREFDLIVVNTITLYYLLGGIKDLPVLWWLHEMDSYYTPETVKGVERVKSNSIKVFAVCQKAKECFDLCNSGLQSGILTYGVKDYFDEDSKYITQHMNPERRFVFAVIGSIIVRKGHDILMEAIDKLPPDIREQVCFIILGDSNETFKKWFIEIACEYPEIKIIGTKTRDEVIELYNEIDVLLCPSREDPMPVVVSEAMMMNVPSIVSNNTGSSALIKNNYNGMVIEADSESLAKAIIYAASHRDEMKVMGKRGRLIYDNYFSWSVFERNVNDIVDEMLSV